MDSEVELTAWEGHAYSANIVQGTARAEGLPHLQGKACGGSEVIKIAVKEQHVMDLRLREYSVIRHRLKRCHFVLWRTREFLKRR
jgi:hypothetical protein